MLLGDRELLSFYREHITSLDMFRDLTDYLKGVFVSVQVRYIDGESRSREPRICGGGELKMISLIIADRVDGLSRHGHKW